MRSLADLKNDLGYGLEPASEAAARDMIVYDCADSAGRRA
jgi:hypothetical protein